MWEGFIFINFDDAPEQTLIEFLGPVAEGMAGYPYGEMCTTSSGVRSGVLLTWSFIADLGSASAGVLTTGRLVPYWQ